MDMQTPTEEEIAEEPPKARPKRRIKGSILVAAVLAIGATGWILSGNLPPEWQAMVAANTPAEDTARAAGAAAAPEPETVEEALPTVRVYRSTARNRQALLRIAGLTEASRSGRVMAETEGALRTIGIEEGDTVARGDTLAQIKIDERQAILRQAEALVQQRAIEYDAATKLANKGFQSEIRRAQAHADLESAKADLDRARTDYAKTRLTAPFDGVIVSKDAEVGDLLKVGDLVATIVDLDPLLIVANVSEREVGRIAEGGLAEAHLITGEKVEGIVSYVAPRADENTRTFRVEVEIPDTGNRFKAGVTAQVMLPANQAEAHLISPALLGLNDVGDVGVKIVDETGTVRFVKTRIVEDSPQGLWVLGLPDSVDLISVGHEFVGVGERVEPVPATVFIPQDTRS